MGHPAIFKTAAPLQTVEFEIYRARLAQFGQWRRVYEWCIGEEFERSCLVGNVDAWRTSAHRDLRRFSTAPCFARWRLLVATDGGTTTKDWTNANAQLLLQRTQSGRCLISCVKNQAPYVCFGKIWRNWMINGRASMWGNFNIQQCYHTRLLIYYTKK